MPRSVRLARPALALLALAALLPAAARAQPTTAQVVTPPPPPAPGPTGALPGRWSPEKAAAWGRAAGWLVGGNYATSSAINQLEMWQAETFDTTAIDRELGWARGIGMNTMRVFLHDIAYRQDSAAFLQRVDQFLAIADRHRIRPMLVLFDAVWDPYPRAGRQRAPKPFLHNSGWVQSPGVVILTDTSRHREMEGYVKGVIGRFRNDRRVIAWDLFNEPDNDNRPSYVAYEPTDKGAYSLVLLRKAWGWAREINPSQPLTAAPWKGDWEDPAKLTPIVAFMLENSDVISFHSYNDSTTTRRQLQALKRYNRPLLCTEYMARPIGSTFETILPIFKAENVAAYNWGLIEGKSQTIFPWDSWYKQYTGEPPVWFHDVFRTNGTPYRANEVALIRSLTRDAAPTPTTRPTAPGRRPTRPAAAPPAAR